MELVKPLRQPACKHPLLTSPQIQSVHCNPVDANLVMTAGNDYTARVVDIRNLMGGELLHGAELGCW